MEGLLICEAIYNSNVNSSHLAFFVYLESSRAFVNIMNHKANNNYLNLRNKILSELKDQSLEEIMQEYNFRKEEERFGNEEE